MVSTSAFGPWQWWVSEVECFIGENNIWLFYIFRPPFKKFSKGVAFFPLQIGDHVFIGDLFRWSSVYNLLYSKFNNKKDWTWSFTRKLLLKLYQSKDLRYRNLMKICAVHERINCFNYDVTLSCKLCFKFIFVLSVLYWDDVTSAGTIK